MISREVLGSISVVISIVSNAIYLTSILKGRTKPHVFTWLAWGLLNAIAFLAQVSNNGGAGSWLLGFGTLACFGYSILALFKGETNITKSDWLCFITSLIAMLLWYFINTPIWSVILITIINVIGYIPTFRKSYSKPYEEPMISWVLTTIGVIVSMMALDNLSVVTALYPLSFVLANVVFVPMVLWRRRVLKKRISK